MKKITFISCMLAGCLTVSIAMAQDKVVVIPMGSSSAKVAGTDKQIQFNDNGTLAGANVYYDKTTGNVGIGEHADTSAGDDLSIVDTDGNTGMYIGTPLNAYINMESMGRTKITMFSASDVVQNFPFISGAKARGTYEAVTPVDTGDKLMAVIGTGQVSNSTGFDLPASPPVGIFFIASELWSASSQGSYMVFATTENAGGGKAVRMRIDHNGNVGIGTGTASPTSTLQVNGYVQLALTSGVPTTTDCDEASERGRMKVDNAAGNLYICMDSGWVAK